MGLRQSRGVYNSLATNATDVAIGLVIMDQIPGGNQMNRWTSSYGIALIAVSAIFWSLSCVHSSQSKGAPAAAGEGNPPQMMNFERGKLTNQQIQGFEREIEAQYRQLDRHYRDYEQVLQGAEIDLEFGEENRLHRKLKRRHLTLARLHEERVALNLYGADGQRRDRDLAYLHRASSSWHENRFDPDRPGVAPLDVELRVLRREVDSARQELVSNR